MSRARIVIEAAAKQDIRETRDYYADKGANAASDFRDELNHAFDLLARHPQATAIAFGRTRLKPMRQFPYVIGYILHEGVIHVTGVQHGGLGWDPFQLRQFERCGLLPDGSDRSGALVESTFSA